MYRVISSFHLFQACGSSLGFPKSKLLGGLSWEIDRSAAALVLGVPSVLSGILFDESHFWHHVTSRKSINDQTRDFTSHTCRLRKVTWCNTILLLQKLYSVLRCWQVTAHRKINSSSLVTTMYSGGVSKGSVYFFYERQWARGYILTCCIKLQKYEGLQTLVSEKIL